VPERSELLLAGVVDADAVAAGGDADRISAPERREQPLVAPGGDSRMKAGICLTAS
jgi:hypothetical protein